jgi:hypothetical protein
MTSSGRASATGRAVASNVPTYVCAARHSRDRRGSPLLPIPPAQTCLGRAGSAYQPAGDPWKRRREEGSASRAAPAMSVTPSMNALNPIRALCW